MNTQDTNPWYRRVLALIILALILLAVIFVAGCGNDAHVESRDKSGAVKYNMPNHFATIAAKCDGHGHRIFEGSEGGLAVVADASCTHVGP